MFLIIKLYLDLNCVLMLNWIVWNWTIFIKMDLALNNLQRLIYHKTQATNEQQNVYFSYSYIIQVIKCMLHICIFVSFWLFINKVAEYK